MCVCVCGGRLNNGKRSENGIRSYFSSYFICVWLDGGVGLGLVRCVHELKRENFGGSFECRMFHRFGN